MALLNFKQRDLIPAAVWVILGLLTTSGAYRLDIGSFHRPGPGMLPFLTGIGLTFLSLPIIISALVYIVREKKKDINVWAGINLRRIGLTGLGLVFFGLILETIGLTVTVFLTTFFLYKVVGTRKTYKVLISALFTALASYFVFVTVLKCQFPSFPWFIFF